jgi:phosphoribosylanthranilate isomerase
VNDGQKNEVNLYGRIDHRCGFICPKKTTGRKSKKGSISCWVNPAPGQMTKYVIQLGKPDQERDSDMVEEGALTSVQYYNELREEEAEDN